MISIVWNTLFYNPLYNGFVFLASILPWADMGVIIVLFTIVVKLALFPLSIKSVKTQQSVKRIEPEVNKIKEKHKKDKQAQALATMELYKKHKIKPFSGFLVILLQIPIIFALYFIFLRGGLPEVNFDILYSFINAPGLLDTNFLGLLDVLQKSLPLALLTGITQFFHTSLSFSKMPQSKGKFGQGSMKEDFARTMRLQMKYVLPVFVAFIAYTLSSAIALYWTTSNIFHILQELYVKRKIKKDDASSDTTVENTAVQRA